MDAATVKSGVGGAVLEPRPIHWKKDASQQLLKLFHSTAALTCPQVDLGAFSPAVLEALEMALGSVERRVREYAQQCANLASQRSQQFDLQAARQLLLEMERSIQFYVEERLPIWKSKSTDSADMPPPQIEGSYHESGGDFHQQAVDQCFPRLVRDMMARGTCLVDDLVADDVLSVTSAESILKKDTDRKVNEEVLKVVRGLSLQDFQSSFLPALEKDAGNAILAGELKSTLTRLQEDARSQSQGRCRVCVLRDRVDPRRLADGLLARGLIPRGLYDDLREKTLPTDKAWDRIFDDVGHTEKLMPVLAEKFPAIHAEMLENDISSLECRCRSMSRGLLEVVPARSEGDVSDIARLSDFTSLLQKGKLHLPEYRMTSKKRGCCFLVVNTNYVDANPSSQDQAYFENTAKVLGGLFQQLGFDLIEKTNLSAMQLLEETRKIAQMDHSAFDGLAVILLTISGVTGDSLHCSDGADVSLEAVQHHFLASRCPSLAGKPKVIYRPAFRGTSLEHGVTTTDEEGRVHNVPDHADFLVIESCPSGCSTKTNRNTLLVCHVELLAAVLERHSHDDFLSCLTTVNNTLSQMRGSEGGHCAASVHSTLTKQLKFAKIQ